MVWLFSRNLRPSAFFPVARTGMRVKTRELRRCWLVCTSDIVIRYRAMRVTPSQRREREKCPKKYSMQIVCWNSVKFIKMVHLFQYGAATLENPTPLILGVRQIKFGRQEF